MTSNYDRQVDIGRKYFLQYDQEKLIKKYHLQADEKYLYISYLSQEYRIDRETAAIEQKGKEGFSECRIYTVVMTIYDMLCHNKDERLPVLTGEWTPVGSFAAAGASPDANLHLQSYADAFSGHVSELTSACEKIGEICPRLAGADVTARIDVFPFFPVMFQFWEGDEEFSPQVRVLWDRNTMQYLHFETTYYLQGDLMERLQIIIEEMVTVQNRPNHLLMRP